MALDLIAEGVDHPGAHVVDRDERGDRGAAGGELLEDDRGVEPRHRRAADVLADVDRADAELCGRLDHVDREVFGLVPFQRMRGDLVVGEGARHVADRDAIGVESELLHGVSRGVVARLS